MSLKLGIKRVTDSCKSKDNVAFYKVEWEECWLHEDVLSSWNELVEQFHEESTKNEDIELLTSNKEEATDKRCYFCVGHDDDEKANSPGHNEKSHALKCMSQEITDIINKRCRLAKNNERSFFLLSPTTIKSVPLSSREKRVAAKPAVAPPVTAEPMGNLAGELNDNAGGTPLFTCPKCNEMFTKFSLYQLHYNLHDINTSPAVSFLCQTCGKSFTSKESLDKHSQLHFTYKVRRLNGVTAKFEPSKISKRSFSKLTTRPVRKYVQRSPVLASSVSVDQEMIDLSQKPFGAGFTGAAMMKPNEQDDSSLFSNQQDEDSSSKLDGNGVNTSVFLDALLKASVGQSENEALLDPKRGDSEFTPEVLQNARQYIKAVSRRRKEKTMRRMMTTKPAEEPLKHSIFGIGVDIELKKCEESLPIVTQVNGRHSYSCKVCGKTFFNKFHHREHFNVHSGEMPYECEFCSKRFAQRSGWNRHIKLHHKYKVFQGPIPYGHHERKDNGSDTQKEEMVPVTIAAVPTNVNTPIKILPNRYVPIAPYPGPVGPFSASGSIPLSPALLSPDRFPNTLESSIPGVFIQAASGPLPAGNQTVAILQDFPRTHTNSFPSHTNSLPNPANSLESAMAAQLPNEATTLSKVPIKMAIFQCKKVRTMDGRLIFMIRVAEHSTIDPKNNSEHDKKTEFAYVLDNSGNVESRIFVSDHPGGNWVDFPLDDLANEVLLERIQVYDDKNRRGPKPRHYQLTPSMLQDDHYRKMLEEEEAKMGKENLEKALSRHHCVTEFKQIEEVTLAPVSSSNSKGEETQPVTTHGRSFRSGKEKRFSCTVCSRKFLAQAHLNDHMLIHTGEFPFKCMFCSRPFRHKSGLNSHHKRHIQNGIFDRPISSKDPNNTKHYRKDKNRSTTTSDIIPETDPDFTTKSKRKGRPPKRMETAANANANENVFKVKMEDDEVDNDYMLSSGNRETVTFDVQDVFECNFCGMNFPMRTAYLKHVNTVHRNITPAASRDNFGESTAMNDELNSDYIQMSDFENTLLDIAPDSPRTKAATGEDNAFISDIKIKEELPDY